MKIRLHDDLSSNKSYDDVGWGQAKEFAKGKILTISMLGRDHRHFFVEEDPCDWLFSRAMIKEYVTDANYQIF